MVAPATPAPPEAAQAVPSLAPSPRLLSWIAAMAEALAVPLLLVDVQGHLRNANMAGARELAHGRLVCLQDERVTCTDEAMREAFAQALQRSARSGQREVLQGGALSISPVAMSRGKGTQTPPLLMLVLPAEASVADACCLFAYQYGLTPTELAVLHGAVHGQSPRDMARARGVTEGTVRKQLARLRRKCGEDSLGTLLPRVQQWSELPLAPPRQRK